jgi:hypothetical protein
MWWRESWRIVHVRRAGRRDPIHGVALSESRVPSASWI